MINDTPLLLWYHMAQAGPPVGEEGLMLDYLINHRIPPTTGYRPPPDTAHHRRAGHPLYCLDLVLRRWS